MAVVCATLSRPGTRPKSPAEGVAQWKSMCLACTSPWLQCPEPKETKTKFKNASVGEVGRGVDSLLRPELQIGRQGPRDVREAAVKDLGHQPGTGPNLEERKQESQAGSDSHPLSTWLQDQKPVGGQRWPLCRVQRDHSFSTGLCLFLRNSPSVITSSCRDIFTESSQSTCHQAW